MKFIQLEVKTTREASELVADLMSDMPDFAGVGIYDAEDIMDAAQGPAKYDYVDEKLAETMGPHVRVLGFFASRRGGGEEGAEIARRFEASAAALKEPSSPIDAGPMTAAWTLIDDAAWADVWKKYYKPQKIGGVTAVPCWTDTAKYEKGKFIVLDPGAAFGTGEHETTRSCIRLIRQLHKEGRVAGGTFIDLGCGSGILGLTAALFGCKSATLIDLDPVAVSAARGNLNLNLKYYPDFGGRVKVVEGDLFQHADSKADIIAANISSDILIANAAGIAAHLNAGGRLILSGVVNARAVEVLKAYTDIGFALQRRVAKGEWNAFLMKGRRG
jgi:ribosomal protein L11 methyltransferase